MRLDHSENPLELWVAVDLIGQIAPGLGLLDEFDEMNRRLNHPLCSAIGACRHSWRTSASPRSWSSRWKAHVRARLRSASLPLDVSSL